MNTEIYFELISIFFCFIIFFFIFIILVQQIVSATEHINQSHKNSHRRKAIWVCSKLNKMQFSSYIFSHFILYVDTLFYFADSLDRFINFFPIAFHSLIVFLFSLNRFVRNNFGNLVLLTITSKFMWQTNHFYKNCKSYRRRIIGLRKSRKLIPQHDQWLLK